ncbi:putative Mitochondrial 2-oxoglutarate/malate carrier protein, partial [Operophtera brumata]
RNDGASPGFGTTTLLGITAGSIGAFVGTPAEVALIRMTADGRLPVEQRRNYKNVVDALMRIVREEGVLKLWRGATPTVCRAMVVNAAQLSTYSQVCHIIQNAAKGTSQVAVVTSLLKTEGVLSLWKGFLPYYARLGPHTVLTFIFLEQLNTAYFRYTL